MRRSSIIETAPTWKEIAADINDISELSQNEKTHIQSSITFLEGQLKDSFLYSLNKARHPYCMMLWANKVAWAKRWIFWFAVNLKIVSKTKSYANLLKRIKRPSKFEEALSVLEVAGHIAVHSIIEFDRKLPNKRMPDITFYMSNSIAIVEVSRLRLSEYEKDVETDCVLIFL